MVASPSVQEAIYETNGAIRQLTNATASESRVANVRSRVARACLNCPKPGRKGVPQTSETGSQGGAS